MNLSPIELLRAAIKAVPALKYALGVAGLVAVVAIVGAFQISPAIAVMGSVVTLVLMVALLIFAKLTKTAKKHFLLPAEVLMWSFLMLVIAAAGLLFTSTFFGWPMQFSALPHSAKIKLSPETHTENRAGEILKTAQLQVAARDYEGAWKTLQSAAAAQPNSDAVLEAQADVAMLWLRNIVVHEPHTFAETVDQLTPTLYAALVKAKGSRAADIYAHLGWAEELKARNNPGDADIEGEFQKAIKLDPQNAYAHAMLAFHLLARTGRESEARGHFDIALAGGRDHEWVRFLQIAAWEGGQSDASNLELVRVINDLRKNGETLTADRKAKLFTEIYWFGASFDYHMSLIRSLPTAEHLATLNWLAGETGWANARPEQRFVLAELKEKNGGWAAALELYRGLADFKTDYSQEVSQGIARCELHVTAK